MHSLNYNHALNDLVVIVISWVVVSDTDFDQILVLLGVPLQAQTSQQVLLSSLDQLIEDVEVPLPVVLVNHAGLFQQVVDDVASYRGALPACQRPERERGGGVERGEDKAGVLRQGVELIMQFVGSRGSDVSNHPQKQTFYYRQYERRPVTVL